MLWQTFVQAKTWGTTPSALLNIEEPYLAYCVDAVVAHFGNYVSSELAHVEGKTQKEVEGRQESLLLRLLAKNQEQKYATPQATM